MRNQKIVLIIVVIVLIGLVVAYKSFSSTGEADKCQKISDSQVREECYYELAVKSAGWELCEKIINGDRSGCFKDAIVS